MTNVRPSHLAPVGSCILTDLYGPLLVYLISCKLFAYLKNYSELCNEVVHDCDERFSRKF